MTIKSQIKSTYEQKNIKKIISTERTFDELDIRIMREILIDSRYSLRQIANKLKVSVGTVANRLRELESNKIIKYYTTMLNHEKIGYELTVITEITVSKGKLLEVDKEISKILNVCTVYDITGLTDAIVIAKFKNREELSNFTKSLLSMPFIERTNTHIVLTTIKEDFRLI